MAKEYWDLNDDDDVKEIDWKPVELPVMVDEKAIAAQVARAARDVRRAAKEQKEARVDARRDAREAIKAARAEKAAAECAWQGASVAEKIAWFRARNE